MQIVNKQLGELKPYKSNPRKNDGAVNAVAESIKEFGFKVPIIIDKDNEIVAGHTRLLAAKQLGLVEVPCIVADDLKKSYKRNGIKDCFCVDCGTEFTVRKDTNPKTCVRCTSSRGGRALKGQRAEMKKCWYKHCDNKIYKKSKSKYCSIECREKDKKVKRECNTCGEAFLINKSAISGKTNATGKYCSRSCYEKHLCRTGRESGRGSQWKKIRAEVLNSFPFCAVCGTTKNLQVHHIVPFRITKDNSKSNLIPLCTKHHKKIEMLFVDTEKEGTNKTTELIWKNILLTQKLATLAVIRGICCDR